MYYDKGYSYATYDKDKVRISMYIKLNRTLGDQKLLISFICNPIDLMYRIY